MTLLSGHDDVPLIFIVNICVYVVLTHSVCLILDFDMPSRFVLNGGVKLSLRRGSAPII